MTAGETSEAVLKAALHFVQTKKEKERSGAANSSSAQGYMRGLGQSFGGNLNKLESVPKFDL